jgi:hypothetical protein
LTTWLTTTTRLGGLLPLSAESPAMWAPAGAWRLPVGDGYAIGADRSVPSGTFYTLRGVEWDGERASHQGADLGCGEAGAPVRAAAAGLVIRVADRGDYGGYGTHVVVAHRLADGVLAYSVYAHLLRDSPRVRVGQTVITGQTLGRVGRTGRATTPHLHFEVRIAESPDERWEHASVEDPLAFVSERLPEHRADSLTTNAYLEWAECAGLVSPAMQDDDALTREVWWRMLAAATLGPCLDPALPSHDVRIRSSRGRSCRRRMPMRAVAAASCGRRSRATWRVCVPLACAPGIRRSSAPRIARRSRLRSARRSRARIPTRSPRATGIPPWVRPCCSSPISAAPSAIPTRPTCAR